jgi:FAD/FMN-containing dehydrogenase
MKHFQQFSLDESTYEAIIGPGTSLGDVDTKLYNAGGRAMAHGVCPSIGSGGHFTIGGLGPTVRQWGTALDHIQEAEVVLADGSIVRASETQNPDLLFAVKGAAASFGIVTEFKVRTQQAPSLAVQYSYTFNLGSAAEKAQLFRDWQDFISDEDLTRKFYSNFVLLEQSVALTGVFFGSKAEYDALGLEDRFPIENPGNIVILTDWLGMVGHVVEDLVLRLVGGVSASFYAKSLGFTPDSLIPSSGIDDLFQYIETANKGTVAWFVTFSLEGGHINDYATDATAFPHRDVLFWMQTFAVNPSGPVTDTIYDFVNGINDVITQSVPESGERAYLGCPDPLMPDAQRAYWGSNLEKLEEIKASIDPNDVFHNPQGVVPAA